MKLSEVQVGGRYTAKVSGKVQVVRIVEIREGPASKWSRARTQIEAVNEATGRRITIRSHQRLRRAASGCEFCSAALTAPPAGSPARTARRSGRRRPGSSRPGFVPQAPHAMSGGAFVVARAGYYNHSGQDGAKCRLCRIAAAHSMHAASGGRRG